MSKKIEYTEDMIDTLKENFNEYQTDGIITILINARGLWLKNPKMPRTPSFLGKAEKIEKAYKEPTTTYPSKFRIRT